jgi:heme-degrading monooxygenase HmoA
MYGTVAHMHVKPGMEETLAKQIRDFEAAQVSGAIAVYVYQMDADPHDYYMAVVWESKESYLANATRPLPRVPASPCRRARVA